MKLPHSAEFCSYRLSKHLLPKSRFCYQPVTAPQLDLTEPAPMLNIRLAP